MTSLPVSPVLSSCLLIRNKSSFSLSRIQSPSYLEPSSPPPSCFANCMHRRWRRRPHHATHLLTPPARNPNLTLDDYSLLPTLFQQPAPADSSSSASGGYACSSPRRQNRLLSRYCLPDGLPASAIRALPLIRMQKFFHVTPLLPHWTGCQQLLETPVFAANGTSYIWIWSAIHLGLWSWPSKLQTDLKTAETKSWILESRPFKKSLLLRIAKATLKAVLHTTLVNQRTRAATISLLQAFWLNICVHTSR